MKLFDIRVYQWIVLFEYSAILCLEAHLDQSAGVVPLDLFGDDLYFELIHPEEISYTYKIRPAKDFGGSWNRTWLNIEMVLADPLHGCSFMNNAESIAGKVVLIERGKCSFVSKAVQAEKAGAEIAIVMDDDYGNDDSYIQMVSDETKRSPSIPAAFILGKNGYMIKRTLMMAGLESAIINIPVNMTGVPMHQWKQPPWALWR